MKELPVVCKLEGVVENVSVSYAFVIFFSYVWIQCTFRLNAVDLCNCWTNFAFSVWLTESKLLTNEKRGRSHTKNWVKLIHKCESDTLCSIYCRFHRLYGIIGMIKGKTNVSAVVTWWNYFGYQSKYNLKVSVWLKYY